MIKIDKCNFLWLEMIYELGLLVLLIWSEILVLSLVFNCILSWWVVMNLFFLFVNGEEFVLKVICKVGLLICKIGKVLGLVELVIVLLMLIFFILEIVIKLLVWVLLIFKCWRLKNLNNLVMWKFFLLLLSFMIEILLLILIVLWKIWLILIWLI